MNTSTHYELLGTLITSPFLLLHLSSLGKEQTSLSPVLPRPLSMGFVCVCVCVCVCFVFFFNFLFYTDVCVHACGLNCVQLFVTNSMDCGPVGPSVHRIFQGQNTGVACHLCLQGIFPTHGSNSQLLHLLQGQAGSLPAEPLGKTI